MDTLHETPDSDSLGTRIAKAMEEVEAWFDGGLPPEPWAA